MGALENSTSNNHSSVGSSSDKCAFSNSGNSAENVTKKNVQEFSHVVSNPGEPVISPKSKMFKPQVSVTCQHECSQDCQPQDVPNENILIEIIKCLSQAITRCEHVLAGSLLKESKIVQSSNVPVFSPNRVIDYEKSLNDNVSQEVGESKEELAPEFKNENKLKVNDVEAKVVVSKTWHGLSVSSDPEAGSHVTDSVSLPANSCRLDSIYPFKGDSFDISVTIEDFKFPALIDTGAAVIVISTQVWDKYLSHKSCCLDSSSTSRVTSVSGSPLSVLGKVWLNFVIRSDVFPFEAYVIKDLTPNVVLGRDFLQKYCSIINFMENIIESSHPEDPLPFADCFGDDWDAEGFDNCVLSVHADKSLTIPAQSEVVVRWEIKFNAERGKHQCQ